MTKDEILLIFKKFLNKIFVLLFSHQLCLTLLWPHGLQPARLLGPWNSTGKILEWVAISFSRGSSQPRDWICVSCIGRQILYHWATWEASTKLVYLSILSKRDHTLQRTAAEEPGDVLVRKCSISGGQWEAFLVGGAEPELRSPMESTSLWRMLSHVLSTQIW